MHEPARSPPNVEDVARSLDFYATALGAGSRASGSTRDASSGPVSPFPGGSLMLNTPEAVSSTERRERAEFADAVLYLMCEDAPARRQQLLEAGLRVGELRAEDYGNDEFGVRDPDGYVIRFSSPRA